jgi:pilus assembly protein Flp/PilA
MTGFMTRFFKDQSGATAVEYGLIAVLIAAAIIAGASAIGTAVNNQLSSQASAVNAAG